GRAARTTATEDTTVYTAVHAVSATVASWTAGVTLDPLGGGGTGAGTAPTALRTGSSTGSRASSGRAGHRRSCEAGTGCRTAYPRGCARSTPRRGCGSNARHPTIRAGGWLGSLPRGAARRGVRGGDPEGRRHRRVRAHRRRRRRRRRGRYAT